MILGIGVPLEFGSERLRLCAQVRVSDFGSVALYLIFGENVSGVIGDWSV